MIIGLTGSIGMGKSAVAAMFAEEGVPVFDADATVHLLQSVGGRLVEPIGAAFPGTVHDGAVDRTRLGAAVFGDDDAIRRLEAIVHPAVGEERQAFLDAHAGALVVFDVPLLFETGGEARVDCIVVVTAAAEVQRARVLARPGMTAERFAAILARQTPDSEKRARADHVIRTDTSFDETRAQVRAVIACVTGRERR
jgi:dephospho-CoA kinase